MRKQKNELRNKLKRNVNLSNLSKELNISLDSLNSFIEGETIDLTPRELGKIERYLNRNKD